MNVASVLADYDIRPKLTGCRKYGTSTFFFPLNHKPMTKDNVRLLDVCHWSHDHSVRRISA